LRISILFESQDHDIDAVQLARLILDIQHLCAMTAGVSSLNSLQPYLPAFQTSFFFKYSNVIELPPSYFDYATVTIRRVRQDSPLSLELLIRIPKELGAFFKDNFKTIVDRFLYGDLERARRGLELDSMREDIRAKRIKNLESVFDLAQKIPDGRLRHQFVESLDSSIKPFLEQHPPIKAVELRDDEN